MLLLSYALAVPYQSGDRLHLEKQRACTSSPAENPARLESSPSRSLLDVIGALGGVFSINIYYSLLPLWSRTQYGRLCILKSKRFYCRGGRSLELDHSPTQGGASA